MKDAFKADMRPALEAFFSCKTYLSDNLMDYHLIPVYKQSVLRRFLIKARCD